MQLMKIGIAILKYVEEIKSLTLSKVGYLTVMIVPMTVVIEYLEKFVFSDWTFLIYLMVLIIVDTALGTLRHYKDGDINSTGFGQFIVKIILYFSALIVTHTLTHFTIDGKHPEVFDWINYLVLSGIILRETISIFENIAAINPGLVPLSLLKRLKGFDNTGNYKKKNHD